MTILGSEPRLAVRVLMKGPGFARAAIQEMNILAEGLAQRFPDSTRAGP